MEKAKDEKVWSMYVMYGNYNDNVSTGLGSIGPGTDTLKTDEGTPVKSIYVSDSSTSDIESLFQGKTKMTEG